MSNSSNVNLGWLYYKDYYSVPESLVIPIEVKVDKDKKKHTLKFDNILPTTSTDVAEDIKSQLKEIKNDIIQRVYKIEEWKVILPKSSDIEEQIALAFFAAKNKRFTSYKIVDNKCLDLDFTDKLALKIIAPGLVSGIGIAHAAKEAGEFKLGFEFDHTTGQPILPGSSVKGAIRSVFPSQTVLAAEEEKNQQKREYLYYIAQQKEAYFIDTFGIKSGREALKLEYQIFENILLADDQIARYKKSFDDREYLFYKVKDDAKGNLKKRKSKEAVAFFDAYFKSGSNLLGIDFITPHKQPKREDREFDQYAEPNPIQFLKVLPETEIVFPFLNLVGNDLELVKRILINQGVGAKGNVGYGKLYDPKVKVKTETNTVAESPTIAKPAKDEKAPPDDRMNANDYEKIDGRWMFVGKLKKAVILQATCVKKDPMNPKRKDFELHIKVKNQQVTATYHDDAMVGKECLVMVKNFSEKRKAIVDIEVIRPL